MGDRYFIPVKCSKCGHVDEDVYYAPTCGFKSHKCSACGKRTNLEKYTGISEAECSNRELIEEIVEVYRRKK